MDTILRRLLIERTESALLHLNLVEPERLRRQVPDEVLMSIDAAVAELSEALKRLKRLLPISSYHTYQKPRD